MKCGQNTRRQLHVRVEESLTVIQELRVCAPVVDRLVHGRPVDGQFAAVKLHVQEIGERADLDLRGIIIISSVTAEVDICCCSSSVESDRLRQVVVPLVQLVLQLQGDARRVDESTTRCPSDGGVASVEHPSHGDFGEKVGLHGVGASAGC